MEVYETEWQNSGAPATFRPLLHVWAVLKFNSNVITPRISAQGGPPRNGTGKHKCQHFPPRGSTGLYMPKRVCPCMSYLRPLFRWTQWYVLWALQDFDWIILYLALKWLSGKSKISFSQSSGFLRHTQVGPEIIKSRLNCSVRVGRQIHLRRD